MASRKSIETSNSNSAPRYTLFLWGSICILNFFVHGSVICDLCTKKLGMQIEPHRNNVYLGAELLLLVSMLFLLAIPKCLLIFKENFYYTSLYTFSIIIYYPKDHSYTRLIIALTNSPFLTYQEDGAEYRAQCAPLDKLPRYLKLRTLGRT